jgi:hypothetical protein
MIVDDKTMEEWGYTLDRHLHYGPKTLAATRVFQRCFSSYQALKKSDWNAAIYWANESQEAWNKLVKCRQEETGHAFYLTPEQYQEAVSK